MSWVEYTEPQWQGLNMRNLNVDEAYLQIKPQLKGNYWLYSLSEECWKCPFTKVTNVTNGQFSLVNFNTARSLTFKVFDQDAGKYAFGNSTPLCTVSSKMGEFGVYSLVINENNTCALETDKESVSIYLPMLLVLLILIAVILLIKGSMLLWEKFRPMNENIETQLSTEKKRLKSLDCFRGMAIVLMIFVNSGGGKYWWIEHAVWNGLHVADIVFPSFLWIMGVCIPISIKSLLTKGVSRWEIRKRILVRSIKLFLIGLCLNSANGPTFENLRIMGVLQRFGIAYLVCAWVHSISSKVESTPPQNNISKIFLDFLTLKVEWIVILTMIAVHLAVIFGLPVPDCPRGYLGPGGKYDMVEHPNCIGGATGYIDRHVLGETHIYQHPTAKAIYDSKPFDPEGLFGSLLTVVQVFLGLHCGIILIVFSNWKERILRWVSLSVVLGIIAGCLCSFSKEDGLIPVNKNLWSLSYVLTTTSLAYLLLSLCYYLIDVKCVWSGHPFTEAGMNAIVLYVGHSLFHKILPWHWRIAKMNTHFILLIESIWNTGLWIIIALHLFNEKIFYNL